MEVLEKKAGGIGASETGKLFTKTGLKSSTAQSLIYEKALEIITGERKDITTVPMQHGLFSEQEAFEFIIKPLYKDAVLCSDESIFIEEKIWATPDAKTSDLTFDIKCPFTPYTFWTNVNSMPVTYAYQLQKQMLATGHKNGFVVFYLTSNQFDEYGNKVEYNISINDRHAFIPVEANKDIQDEILVREREVVSLIQTLSENMAQAIEVDDLDFFNLCKTQKVTLLKNKYNVNAWSSEKLVRFRNHYYTVE